MFLFAGGAAFGQTKQQLLSQYKASKTKGDAAEGARLLDKLEKQWPADTTVLYKRGQYQHFVQNDQNGALASYSKALRTNPLMVQALIGRALVFEEKGLYDKAITDLSAAIRKQPSSLDSWFARGGCHFKSGATEAALADYQVVMKEAPTYALGHVEAAGCLRKLGRKAEAEEIYRKALLMPGADVLALQCYYGKFLLNEGRFSEAAQQLDAAMRTGSDRLDGEDYNNAAVAAYKTKNLTAAARYFDKAVQLAPKNVEYKINYASLAIDELKWSRVLELAREAIALEPDNASANMLMAVGLIKTGNETEGRKYQARSKELSAKQ